MLAFAPQSICFTVLVGCLLIALGTACSPGPDPGSDLDGAADAALEIAVGTDAGNGAAFLARCGTATDLGVHETAAGGKSGSLRFDLPLTASSFVITVQGVGDHFYNIAALARADGLSIVPKSWIALAGQPVACVNACPNRVVAQPGAAAFLFPNTPLLSLKPGPITFRIYAFTKAGTGKYPPVKSSIRVRVHVLCNTNPQSAQKAQLAINLGLTGAGGYDVSTALKQPRIAKALAVAASIYAKVGIELAPIRVFKAGAQTLITSQEGASSELSKLFRSGKVAELGVNVMLVSKIYSAKGGGPGESLLSGVSGGIPGPPGIVGTDRSGIAIALHLASGQQDVLGYTIAHELGHFLGLFHTVEVPTGTGPPLLDNIADTGTSQSNLMHWSVGESNVELSAGQREVLHHSPWLRRAAK